MKLPLKTLIVEDSEIQARVLVRRIKKFHYDLIHVSDDDIVYSLEEAKIKLDSSEYDLSILDIKMGEERCFNLFKKIDTSRLGIVAYLTAFKEHTNEELASINPFFFINKPTNIFDIGDFIYSLRIHLNQRRDLEGYPSHYLFKDGKNNLIALKDEHIYYIENDNVYSIIHYRKNDKNEKIVVRGTLKNLELNHLRSDKYWRVAKSFIVNNEKVDKYGKSDRGYGEIFFNEGVIFNVPSGDRIQYSKDYLKNYIKNMD